MSKANKDLRELIKRKGIYYWVVASHYGVTDVTFSKMLREELPEEKKEKVRKAIRKAEEELKSTN